MHAADSQIAQRFIRPRNQLMRGLCPAGRADGYIPRRQRKFLFAVAQDAAAGEDDEHLVIGQMAVIGPALLAGRDLHIARAEPRGAQRRGHRRLARLKALPMGLCFHRQGRKCHNRFHIAVS